MDSYSYFAAEGFSFDNPSSVGSNRKIGSSIELILNLIFRTTFDFQSIRKRLPSSCLEEQVFVTEKQKLWIGVFSLTKK